MTKPNEPAHPVDLEVIKLILRKPNNKDKSIDATGLTKREHFAAMAMQGIRSNPSLMLDAKTAAIQAVNDADALITALNK